MKSKKLSYNKILVLFCIIVILALITGCLPSGGSTTTDLPNDENDEYVPDDVVPENGGMDTYDPGFVDILNKLYTHEKTCNYMNKNFTYGAHDER